MEKNNAQVALEASMVYWSKSSPSHLNIKDTAEVFLEWLESKSFKATPQDAPRHKCACEIVLG